MTNLKSAMTAVFYFIVFTLIGLSQVFADVCDDAVLEFQSEAHEIMSKRMIAYDNLREFAGLYSEMKAKIGREPCLSAAIDATNSDRQLIKEKRIETISKYLKLGIKEEGGKDITIEYDYLTGKSKKFKYDFEDVFNNSAGKLPEPSRKYEDVVPPKKDPVVVVKPKEPANPGKCSDVMIENEAVNLQNVRNQDSVGWCYAYTAADLLSLKLNKKISAVSLYNSGQEISNDISDRNSSNGGDIENSLENYIAKKGGLCLEEDLPSTDFKFCTTARYNDFLKNLITVARENRFDEELRTNTCFGKDLQSAFPGANISMIRSHINRYGQRKLIEAIYDQQCAKISFKGIKVSAVTVATTRVQPDVVMKALSDQLSKNEAAGIGYNYNSLNGEEGMGGHGSVVVGRRTNPETGSCEYLVRNSWGKNCEQKEGAGLSCHKNCDASGCRYSGHFWASEERLKKSILSVTTLQ